MSAVDLVIASDLLDRLLAHMRSGADEQLAFLLARWDGSQGRVFEIRQVASSGFEQQSPWHISLGDDERAQVIKWAHGRAGALVEAHAHRGPWPAQFSPTDLAGLAEFVPHVWWRLQHRPYAALVFAETSFDALVWRSSPQMPERLGSIVSDRARLLPTNLSSGLQSRE